MDKYFQVVVVNGLPGSGKTLFENMCQLIVEAGQCMIYSTITQVKEIARVCGWNGEKTPESRKFLSDLKDLLTNFNDFPFQSTLSFIEDFKDNEAYFGKYNRPHIIFIDCREPQEIKRFVDELGAKTLLIRRPDVEKDQSLILSNHADKNVYDYKYDYVIMNDGTLGDLKDKAEDFINLLLKKIKI